MDIAAKHFETKSDADLRACYIAQSVMGLGGSTGYTAGGCVPQLATLRFATLSYRFYIPSCLGFLGCLVSDENSCCPSTVDYYTPGRLVSPPVFSGAYCAQPSPLRCSA